MIAVTDPREGSGPDGSSSMVGTGTDGSNPSRAPATSPREASTTWSTQCAVAQSTVVLNGSRETRAGASRRPVASVISRLSPMQRSGAPSTHSDTATCALRAKPAPRTVTFVAGGSPESGVIVTVGAGLKGAPGSNVMAALSEIVASLWSVTTIRHAVVAQSIADASGRLMRRRTFTVRANA